MGMVLSNNSTSTTASAIGAADTAIAIQPGDAVRFPSLIPDEWFPVTIVDAAGNMEIARATARNGSILTVTRGLEGTSAKAFPAGSRVDVRLTAGAFLEAIITSQFVTSVAGMKKDVVLGIQHIELLEATLNAMDTAIQNYKTNFDKIDLTKDNKKPVSEDQKTALDLKLNVKGGEDLGGFKSAPVDHENASGKNIVLSCDVRNYHTCKNNGNFIVTAPADGWYTTVLYVENVEGVGGVTFAGYGSNVFGEIEKVVGKKYQLISVQTGSFKTLTIRGAKE